MHEDHLVVTPQRSAWNKGKLVGAKPPLRPKHVWAIRTKLQVEGDLRELAMFNLAIDSKLRGCDIVALKVDDVAPNGYAVERATVRQKKTGQPVKFELTEQTRQAIDEYLKAAGMKGAEFLFPSRRNNGHCITTRHYARRGVGCEHWTGCESFRHALAAPNQSNSDLSPHREPPCGSTFARPSQN